MTPIRPYSDRARLVAAGFVGAVFIVVMLSAMMVGMLVSPGFSSRVSAFLGGAEYVGSDRVVRQVAQHDCGPATLVMVLRDLGKSAEPTSLAAAWGFAAREISFADMIRVAEAFNVKATPWLLSWSDFVSAPKPVIARINGNHFVVVDAVTDTAVLVRDPAIGVLRYSKGAFLRVWRGESLVFSQTVASGFSSGGSGVRG